MFASLLTEVYMAELRKSVFITDLCAEAYTCYRPPPDPSRSVRWGCFSGLCRDQEDRRRVKMWNESPLGGIQRAFHYAVLRQSNCLGRIGKHAMLGALLDTTGFKRPV